MVTRKILTVHKEFWDAVFITMAGIFFAAVTAMAAIVVILSYMKGDAVTMLWAALITYFGFLSTKVIKRAAFRHMTKAEMLEENGDDFHDI